MRRLAWHWPFVLLVALATLTSWVGADDAVTIAAAPSPAMSPSEVVQLQVDALRDNGRDNDGIALTYRFASPANKRVTGPWERFAAMVQSPPYDRLLNHRRAEYGPTRIDADQAMQRVVITDRNSRQVGYIWHLSRQTEGQFADCWMTDAVIATDRTEPTWFARSTVGQQ